MCRQTGQQAPANALNYTQDLLYKLIPQGHQPNAEIFPTSLPPRECDELLSPCRQIPSLGTRRCYSLSLNYRDPRSTSPCTTRTSCTKTSKYPTSISNQRTIVLGNPAALCRPHVCFGFTSIYSDS